MSTAGAWADLARNLQNRYPHDFAERLQAYRDGTDPDLQRWRAIGGDKYVRPPAKPRVRSWALVRRNDRIRAAYKSGVARELIAERFGMSPQGISKILGSVR